MSDVSKTNELIAKAREAARDKSRKSKRILNKLASALESVRAERDAALVGKTYWREAAIKAKDQRDAALASVGRQERYIEELERVDGVGLTAERDAALAAIAAVNAIHVEREHRTLDGTYLGGTVCDGCRRPWPCPTVQALDGAPEPEVKP